MDSSFIDILRDNNLVFYENNKTILNKKETKIMKKLVLGLAGLAVCGIALVMTFKFGYNVGYYKAKDDATLVCEVSENEVYVTDDEECMNQRIREDFGAEYYGELINSDDESGVITFMVYDSEDMVRYTGTYERFSCYCTYIPTEYGLNEM